MRMGLVGAYKSANLNGLACGRGEATTVVSRLYRCHPLPAP